MSIVSVEPAAVATPGGQCPSMIQKLTVSWLNHWSQSCPRWERCTTTTQCASPQVRKVRPECFKRDVWDWQAQQEVPSWLEAAAFSGHGPSGFNPPRKHFASTDLRKVTGSSCFALNSLRCCSVSHCGPSSGSTGRPFPGQQCNEPAGSTDGCWRWRMGVRAAQLQSNDPNFLNCWACWCF